jgi:outer membrane receptor protein involved in Fe transport
VGVEGFYKWLDDRPVPTGNAPPRYVNDGQGRVYGAELSLEARPDPRTFGYLAYTLSRSERRDLDRRWRLFDQDQTHILALVLSRALGAGWELGARFRLVSGNPETPIVGSVYDVRSGVYLPVSGRVNSVRGPAFHQLDLRVEKQFRAGALTLAPYLDVQNVYNAENVQGRRYSYDYRESEAVSGLPIFPNFGVRGEL